MTSGPKPKNVVGEKYGYMEIIGDAPKKGAHRQVAVRCICGTEKIVGLSTLRVGDAKSCGCKKVEAITTHGCSQSNPLYRTWSNMKSRCNDPNAKYFLEYGGRGIKLCEEWEDSFESFHQWAITSGYQPNLTLDRKNNSEGYSGDNCRWVNRTTQQRNRRSHKASSSQYIGVSFIQRTQKWMAGIKVKGESINIGSFTTEFEAAKARDQYIINNVLEDFTMNNVL